MNRQVYLSYDRLNDFWRAYAFEQIVSGFIRPRLLMPTVSWLNYEAATAEIRDFLENTAVTVILIGSKTAEQPWVRYELDASIARGNGLLGIYVHNMADPKGDGSPRGVKPLIQDGFAFPAYDWDQNPRHFWIEVKAAAKRSAHLRKRRIVYFPSLGW